MADNSSLISTRRSCRNAEADFSSAVCEFLLQYRAFEVPRSLISCRILASRFEMWFSIHHYYDHTLMLWRRFGRYGKFTAEDFVKSLQSSRCSPELVSVQVPSLRGSHPEIRNLCAVLSSYSLEGLFPSVQTAPQILSPYSRVAAFRHLSLRNDSP